MRKVLLVPVLSLFLVLSLTSPAHAAAPNDKLQVATRWTQTTAASQTAWLDARRHQNRWAAYHFDWTTDNCTLSPDQPLGFDFRLACNRHDFGYQNFTALRVFTKNKSRIDDAFHADLLRICLTYSVLARPACDALALTYYRAVQIFGWPQVTGEQIDAIADKYGR
jgi:hypothetical protein